MKYLKKLIAPIIIMLILIAYYVLFAIYIAELRIPTLTKALGAIVPLVLAGVNVFVAVQRIKEVRSKAEDGPGGC